MTTKLAIENYGEEFTTIINSMPSEAVTLAGQWHDGQFSALYALSSTGRLTPGSLARIGDRSDALEWVKEHYGRLRYEWRGVEKQAGSEGIEGDAVVSGAAFLAASAIEEWADGELNPADYDDDERVDFDMVRSMIQLLANVAEAYEFDSDSDESDDE